jgi:hypothetical protein
MKSNRSFWLVKTFVAVLLGTCFMTGVASAQVWEGKFTLPFAAQWGKVVLPAGEYRVTLKTMELPAMVSVQDRGRNVRLVMANSYGQPTSSHNELIIVRNGGNRRIHALHLADRGVVFYYLPPKGEREILAQGPVLIQRIPISVNGS